MKEGDDIQYLRKTTWATIVTAFVLIIQLGLLVYQLALQKTTLTLDERAWVGVVGNSVLDGKVLADPKTGRHYAIQFSEASVKIRNSGRTPALKVDGEFIGMLLTSGCPTYTDAVNGLPDAALSRKTPGVVGKPIKFEGQAIPPGVEREFQTLQPGTTDIAIPPWIQGVQPPVERGATLYVVGRLTYHDVFSATEERTTDFCLMNNYSTGAGFKPCPCGNTMN